mmetsp:Transcript_16626/g.47388  ORF Transcript_16626/g.47388 Transcript_16626/m.47388 type:complete len:384 (+) Transcript_16626:290-1441(+)
MSRRISSSWPSCAARPSAWRKAAGSAGASSARPRWPRSGVWLNLLMRRANSSCRARVVCVSWASISASADSVRWVTPSMPLRQSSRLLWAAPRRRGNSSRRPSTSAKTFLVPGVFPIRTSRFFIICERRSFSFCCMASTCACSTLRSSFSASRLASSSRPFSAANSASRTAATNISTAARYPSASFAAAITSCASAWRCQATLTLSTTPSSPSAMQRPTCSWRLSSACCAASCLPWTSSTAFWNARRTQRISWPTPSAAATRSAAASRSPSSSGATPASESAGSSGRSKSPAGPRLFSAGRSCNWSASRQPRARKHAPAQLSRSAASMTSATAAHSSSTAATRSSSLWMLSMALVRRRPRSSSAAALRAPTRSTTASTASTTP